LENLSVYRRIIVELISEEVTHWIRLAEDRIQRLALVNTTFDLRVPWKVGHFSISFPRRILPRGVGYASHRDFVDQIATKWSI